MSRKIYCTGCNKHMGEIRDASLRVGIKYLCDTCDTKRKAADMRMQSATQNGQKISDFLHGFTGTKQ